MSLVLDSLGAALPRGHDTWWDAPSNVERVAAKHLRRRCARPLGWREIALSREIAAVVVVVAGVVFG